MLSRVAETIYWMQRYRERAENTARLVYVNLNLSADAPKEVKDQWFPMVQTTEGESYFKATGKPPTAKNVINFLTFDRNNPNSILSCLSRSRENARAIRETISSEMWVELNTIYLFVQTSALNTKKTETSHRFFNRIIRQCQLLTGIADTCLSHSEAWYFGRMGNLLERADMTTRILDVKYFMLLPSPDYVGTTFDNIQWCSLLKSASALEVYRKTWHQIRPDRVVDFLLLHEEFPRAVLSCLLRIEKSLDYIVHQEGPANETHPVRQVKRLINELRTLSGERIIEAGFHEFMDRLQLQLSQVHEALQKRYFSLDIASDGDKE